MSPGLKRNHKALIRAYLDQLAKGDIEQANKRPAAAMALRACM